jgi:hypothetical protein
LLLAEMARKADPNVTDREAGIRQANEVLQLGKEIEQMSHQYGVSEAEVAQLDSILQQLQFKPAATTQSTTLLPPIPPPTTMPVAPSSQPTTRVAP